MRRSPAGRGDRAKASTARTVAAFLGLLLAASATPACGGPAQPACARSYRVGLATTTADETVQEESAEAVQGLRQARSQASLCIAATAVGSSLAALAAQGNDVVIGVGPGFAGAALALAKARPKVAVAVLDAPVSGPPANLLGVSFRVDQAAFLAGMVAGFASHTHVVSGVYGRSDEATRALRTGFEHGVLYASPTAVVRGIVQPPGPAFATTAWSSEIALDQVGVGADVLFGSPGTAGDGVLQAIAALGRTPAGGPVYCVGVQVDEYDSFPAARPCLLTSAEKRFGPSVPAVLRALRGARWAVPALSLGAGSGAVGEAPLHDKAGVLNADQRAQLEAARRGLADGKLSTGVG